MDHNGEEVEGESGEVEDNGVDGESGEVEDNGVEGESDEAVHCGGEEEQVLHGCLDVVC